jgi:hypothetical protein
MLIWSLDFVFFQFNNILVSLKNKFTKYRHFLTIVHLLFIEYIIALTASVLKPVTILITAVLYSTVQYSIRDYLCICACYNTF